MQIYEKGERECKVCNKGWIPYNLIRNIDEKLEFISYSMSISNNAYNFSAPCKCDKGEEIINNMDLKINSHFRDRAYDQARKLHLNASNQYYNNRLHCKITVKMIKDGLYAYQYLYSEDQGESWVWDSPYNPEKILTVK